MIKNQKNICKKQQKYNNNSENKNKQNHQLQLIC